MSANTRPSPNRLAFTAKETCEMLGISLKTLSRLEQRQLLLPLKALRKKLYTLESINKFLEDVK